MLSTSEMKQDIQETEAEIKQLENEIETLSKNRHENKVEIYLKRGKIIARKEFITKLEMLLKGHEKGGLNGKSATQTNQT